MTNDEMASSEMRKWKEEEERKHIEENVMLTDASEKKIGTVSIAHDDIPKPVESKEDSESLPPKETPAVSEPAAKTVVIPTELDKEREEQIAALLKQIPAAPPTPKKEESKRASEKIRFRVEPKASTASPAVKEPVKEPVKERFSLPVRANAESAIDA